MGNLILYTSKGVKSKKNLALPRELGGKENVVLLAQAIRVYENRSHKGLSKTKTRGEISASTRKIYRQKGTGRARHGAVSAPIFVGGGKAHGPDGRKRKLMLPKKMAKRALSTAFLLKQKENRLVSVDGLSSIKKTREVGKLLKKIFDDLKIVSKNPKVTFVLSDNNMSTSLYVRNIKNTNILPFRNLNAYEIYNTSLVILDKEAIVVGGNREKAKVTAKENTTNKTDIKKNRKRKAVAIKGGNKK
jgi:large subunit ribosomal protein L4